ncbi:MAG: hypothetical protein ABR884_02175 [Minisyncoccia bacterium]|jgi:hypothetical protein
MKNDSDEIINTIKSGETKMHSRAYFMARAALVLLAAVLLFLLILFVATFIVFALQENGGFFATNFGPAGWGAFFASLPWTLLLLSLALVLILWIVLRRYSVVYHQPFLYILLLLIVMVSLSCVFISAGSIHGGIYRYVSRNPIPVISGVYEFETAPAGGVYRGQVVTLSTSSFVLENILGQTSTVLVTPVGIDPGDYVIVFGHGVATATIQASGVETIVDYQ